MLVVPNVPATGEPVMSVNDDPVLGVKLPALLTLSVPAFLKNDCGWPATVGSAVKSESVRMLKVPVFSSRKSLPALAVRGATALRVPAFQVVVPLAVHVYGPKTLSVPLPSIVAADEVTVPPPPPNWPPLKLTTVAVRLPKPPKLPPSRVSLLRVVLKPLQFKEPALTSNSAPMVPVPVALTLAPLTTRLPPLPASVR